MWEESSSRDAKNLIGDVGQSWVHHWYMSDCVQVVRSAKLRVDVWRGVLRWCSRVILEVKVF